MSTHRLPIVIPLSRPWPQRLREHLQAWFETWQRRRALRRVCGLSAATLDDVAAPDEWRAAAAHCRAREEMERSLLRVGIVSGAPW